MLSWNNFQTHNLAPEQAFEAMCNQLFDSWCRRELQNLKVVNIVNGSGGDGGVEAFANLNDNIVVGMQAKWFREPMQASQFNQIQKSITTALTIRPNLSKYIVCIPKNLTSIKMGKGNKPIKNSEMSGWDTLVTKFPNVELVRWDENKLLAELQEGSNSGIFRYWFEKSEISFDLISSSYSLQASGWLNKKYTPDIHIQGIIHEKLTKFAGSCELQKEAIEQLSNIENQLNRFKQACERFLIFHKDTEISKVIEPVYNASMVLLEHFNQLKNTIMSDSCCKLEPEKFTLTEFHKLKMTLNENEFRNIHGVYDLTRRIDAIINSEIPSILDDLKYRTSNKLIIIGNPGTGKTHGVADCVKVMLDDGCHIPILVQAQKVTQRDSWKDMLIRALRISVNWNEDELFNALEALSFRRETVNRQFDVRSKILIIIDGIDESAPLKAWCDRISEIDSITSKYTRIKFCITSRPNILLEYDPSYLYLPDEGDVPVYRLFPSYMDKFNITISDSNQWLKWSLRTPLTLSLFCKLSNNQKFDKNTQKPSTVITSLLRSTIGVLEEEFCTKYSLNQSQYIYSSLLVIYEQFIANHEAEKNNLLQLLMSSKQLDRNAYDNILNFLCNYGLLYKYTEYNESVTSVPKEYYSLGIQTFFDYILALRIYEENPCSGQIIIPQNMYHYEDSLRLLALIYLEEHDQLISNDNIPVDLQGFALTNASPNVVEKYADKIKSLMCKNPQNMRCIVNDIVLPVSRIESHPLGSKLLHSVLNNYEIVASRDLVWSIPEYLFERSYVWNNLHELQLKEYPLLQEDNYDGLPLVYAWALTGVTMSNTVFYRTELMKWALERPMEYYKLFELVAATNDPQMRTELFSIAMGLVFSTSDEECIKSFGTFVYENIFQNISNNLNAAIRYYSRAMAEKAFDMGFLSDIKLCRPPYKTNCILDMDKNAAINGTSMDGFGPFDYDLSRYVLCDYITHRFFVHERKNVDDIAEDSNTPYNYFSERELVSLLRSKKYPKLQGRLKAMLKQCKSERHKRKIFRTKVELPWLSNMSDREPNKYDKHVYLLLDLYKNLLSVNELTPEQFILSAAYGYLLKMGWDRTIFIGQPNNSTPDEIIGIDLAITRQYWPATHGAKSSVMSFAEKYTWIARNEILGYLADKLLLDSFNCNMRFADDYGLFSSDFDNPIQELSYKIHSNLPYVTIPEDISPYNSNNIDKNAIDDWIREDFVPNFNLWLYPENEYIKKPITLYSFNTITNLVGSTHMWITSGFIENRNFEYFINDVQMFKEILCSDFLSMDHFHTEIETDCYISPKDICTMNWKKEIDSKIKMITASNDMFITYDIHKSVGKCLCGIEEVHYILPSEAIRTALSINDGDGYFYRDNNEIKAVQLKNNDQVCLFADNCLIDEMKNYKFFWLFRLYREPNIMSFYKYSENKGEHFFNSDRRWVVWYEKGEINVLKYADNMV